MKKINTKNWHEFKISDLFEITGSKTTAKKDLNLEFGGEYPYITTAATNNGVSGYSSIYTEEGNVLTVDSAVLGTTFYQGEPFSASDHVEKLIPKFELNENIGLFIASIMNGSARIYGYAYNEKRSQTALQKETIILPIDKMGNPDWKYMETTIKKIVKKVNCSIKYLQEFIKE